MLCPAGAHAALPTSGQLAGPEGIRLPLYAATCPTLQMVPHQAAAPSPCKQPSDALALPQQEALAFMCQRENSNGLPPFWEPRLAQAGGELSYVSSVSAGAGGECTGQAGLRDVLTLHWPMHGVCAGLAMAWRLHLLGGSPRHLHERRLTLA